jgi:hypothetical protein
MPSDTGTDDVSLAGAELGELQSRKRGRSVDGDSDRPHKFTTLPHDAPLTSEEKEALAAELPDPDSVSSGDSEFSLSDLKEEPDVCAGDCPPDASHFVVDGFSTSLLDPEPLCDYVELGFAEPSPKLRASMNKALADEEHLVIRSYQSGLVETVVVKEFNTLTLSEARKHADECKAAILLELNRWNSMGAWRRFPRKDSNNILDSRWVLKW